MEGALLKLVNESSAMAGIGEEGIRQTVGNTNFSVWKLRIDEARGALSDQATPPAESAEGKLEAIRKLVEDRRKLMGRTECYMDSADIECEEWIDELSGILDAPAAKPSDGETPAAGSEEGRG